MMIAEPCPLCSHASATTPIMLPLRIDCRALGKLFNLLDGPLLLLLLGLDSLALRTRGCLIFRTFNGFGFLLLRLDDLAFFSSCSDLLLLLSSDHRAFCIHTLGHLDPLIGSLHLQSQTFDLLHGSLHLLVFPLLSLMVKPIARFTFEAEGPDVRRVNAEKALLGSFCFLRPGKRVGVRF